METKRPQREDDISNEYQNTECKFIRNFGKEHFFLVVKGPAADATEPPQP
jgi:hypothetical protein